ncbi:MAG: MobA/MobL family protein, partial [Pseudomonadota bacterium]
MAIHHLNLRLVGKKTHAPGAAGAAMRYFTRAAACQRIDAVGGASTHPKALEREAVRQEEASRKNARICDKFVVSLPAEMSLAERVAVTRAFLVRLTQDGRARAFACYHGQETQNPHVHIMFFDRDSETGKRVQRMTERGGADRIRLMWEEVCNTHLARGGHEDLIDRRSLAAIEQERDAGSVDRLEEIESFD